MSNIKFILQGIDPNQNHFLAINQLFTLSDIDSVFISVAFMKSEGIASIAHHLTSHAQHTTVFVGINNNITSIQALIELLHLGIKPIVVDTNSPNIIFHPKIYLTSNATNANVIIGSANATTGGYTTNIEASTFISLDKSLDSDIIFIDSIINSFQFLRANNPLNVYQVCSKDEILQLFNQGKLCDENTPYQTNTQPIHNQYISETPRINLYTSSLPQNQVQSTFVTPQPSIQLKPISPLPSVQLKPISPLHSVQLTPITTQSPTLVWQSKPLSERDLNIPSGLNTHVTGSMTLTKGTYANIDQRHYFRDIVFNQLSWAHSDSKYPHLEYATACFELRINNISHGTYNLTLKHDPRTDTTSYYQNNAMTHLKWGEIKTIIADRQLLGKTLRIYKLSSNIDFILEII